MHILLTRPLREAQDFERRLRAAGHEVTLSPVIAIEPCGTLPDCTGFDGLIASSANAFDCLPADAMINAQISDWAAIPVYCVGARTAEAAKRRGVSTAVKITENGPALLDHLVTACRPATRFCYLAGKHRKPDLEDGLISAGHQVATHVIYEAIATGSLTKPAAAALAGGQIDVVMHFSRRSAAIFTQLVCTAGLTADASAVRHICISTDAAEGLNELSAAKITLAAHPDADGMISALPSASSGC